MTLRGRRPAWCSALVFAGLTFWYWRRTRPAARGRLIDPGGSTDGDQLDVDAMIQRFRDRAAAVRNRPLPPIAGEERAAFLEQAQLDFQDFAIIGDAAASVEDGVLVLRIDLRPPPTGEPGGPACADAALAAIDAANAAIRDRRSRPTRPSAPRTGARQRRGSHGSTPTPPRPSSSPPGPTTSGAGRSPRTDYPDGRAGYLRWRTAAKKRHAAEVGRLLRRRRLRHPTTIDRVQPIIRKEGLGRDPAVQVHEDAVCLVFLETQLDELADVARATTRRSTCWCRRSPR